MPRRIVFVYFRQLLWWLGLLLLAPSVLMYVDEHWIIKVLSNAPSVESVSPFLDGNDFYAHRAFFALFVLNTLGYFAWFANRIIWFIGLCAVTIPESISDQRSLKIFTGTVTVLFFILSLWIYFVSAIISFP